MLSKSLRKFLSLILLVGASNRAWAHPMGNFSVNHYSKITLEPDGIHIRYYIDLAEIPTYQELQQANIAPADADPNSAVVKRYVAARGEELGRGLTLEIDGSRVPLRLVASSAIFPPGAGGLPTMKMGFLYDAPYPSIRSSSSSTDQHQIRLHYGDNNFQGHAGWKEIVALSSGGDLLRSSVPAVDGSRELSNYPTDLLNSPPQDLEASLVAVLPASSSAPSKKQVNRASTLSSAPSTEASNARQPAQQRRQALPAKSAASVQSQAVPTSASKSVDLHANLQHTPRSRFTELIQAQHLSVWFLFIAALIAVGLGGLHALEPGHGKTIVAAYLVGSKGTARHALLLGLVVTVSHTAGVVALGAITLCASRYIVPEQLYPWLGVLSGLTIAGLGCYMLLRRLSGNASDHSHASGESHLHWQFWKPRNVNETEIVKSGSDVQTPGTASLIQLFTLGITGGIIPCPAALIVLLSAVALHRVALGMFLIFAFSIGLAAVLIAFGMLIVYARRFMSLIKMDGPLTRKWLPVVSSGFITILGALLTLQSVSTMHFNAGLISREKLGTALFVTVLGLVLGMRHSTDADHVVAISTIVSKQRSIRNAAFVGSVWGIGHTITIFIVGSLIILCGVEIPARVGLSMEFSVAIMLVLLGVLNLFGLMQKITKRLTPGVPGSTETPLLLEQTNMTSGNRWLKEPITRLGAYQCLRPLVIGLVHGLAGSAAVALLVLSTIHNPVWATIYLLIFGAGTMLGMMCMTAAIAVPLSFGASRFTKLSQYLGVVSGVVSLSFGSVLVYQLGFLGGLFTGHPQWTPR
jgi:ABC-type nickel/cobalt efflux system permease component RcnA